MATIDARVGGGVGLVILIVIIVLIVIAIHKNKYGSSTSTSSVSSVHAHRRHRKNDSLIKEKSGVKHCHHNKKHHHKCKDSSSSSSSSSSDSKSKHDSDDFCFRQGGLGDVCDANLAPCGFGLACLNGRCVCPRPSAPIVTAVERDLTNIVVTWNPVIGANYYELILLQENFDGNTAIRVVRALRNATTYTFTNVPPGNFRVEVRSGSDICGIVAGTPAGIARVIGVGCETNAECAEIDPNTPICQAGVCVVAASGGGGGIGEPCTTDSTCAGGLTCENGVCACAQPAAPVLTLTVFNFDALTVSWLPVPTADYYSLYLYRVTGTPPRNVPVENVQFLRSTTNSFTFGGLIPGVYFVEAFAGSDECGSSSTSGSESQQVTIDCVNDTQCETGQRCADNACAPGDCVCPQPAALEPSQIILTLLPPNSIVVTWQSVPNADFYKVTLFQVGDDPDANIRLQSFEIVDSPARTVTFEDVETGAEYFVEIVTGSTTCGISVTQQGGVSRRVFIPETGTPGCDNPPPTVTNVEVLIISPTVNNQRQVRVSWRSAAGADRYLLVANIVNTNSCGEQELFREIVDDTNEILTVDVLNVGQRYRFDVYSDSELCGLNQVPRSSERIAVRRT